MPGLYPPFVVLGTAPRVLEVVAETRRRVRVVFSEAMRVDATLLATASYTLTPDGGSASRTIVRVRPGARVGPTSVILTLSGPLTVGSSNYRLDCDTAIEDVAGTPLNASYLGADFSVAADVPAAEAYQGRQRLYVGVRIEGIGSGSSISTGRRYVWCSRRPRDVSDYSSVGGDAVYLPDLLSWPSHVESRMHPLGGVAESGELTVAIVDGGARQDRLTQLLAIHRRPINALSAELTRTATSATFLTNTGLTAGGLVFPGGECLRLSTNTSGTTWTVSRGALDTAAQRHASGAVVYAGSPLLYGRRMRLFVGLNDGAHASTDEEEVEAGWAIDSVELSDDLLAWVLRGRSQLKYLDRLLDRSPFQATLTAVDEAHSRVSLRPVRAEPTAYRGHFNDRVFLRFGKNEIRAIAQSGLLDSVPVAGTRIEDWKDGELVRQVFVARADATGTDYGSFRYQAPGAETTSRSTGTWTPDAHAIVILLCLATGKSDLDDNTPDNYTSGYGNFSALPPGVGLGMPAAEIDFGSALDVWHRAPHLVLEHFVLDSTETGREVFDRILKLTGIDVRTVSGLLTFGYTRTPLADDVVASWDVSTLVGRDGGDGNLVPQLRARIDQSLAIGAVQFKARNARGDEVELTYSDADFPEVFGDVRGLYSVDEKPLPIDARDVRADDNGGEPELLRQRALQVLRGYRRAPWRYSLVTPRTQRSVQPGDFVHLTYPQLPDLAEARRGVVEQTIKITSKKETISRERVDITWDAVSYPAGRVGRLAPSARVSGAPTGSVVPVSANRYTDPQARGGLPSTDAAAFRVGDRVCLKSRGGLRVTTTPAYQTVTAIGSNTLTLDGTFGGAPELTTGGVLAYVDRSEATTTQAEAFVFLSDRATRTVGATTETPWTYGEG